MLEIVLEAPCPIQPSRILPRGLQIRPAAHQRGDDDQAQNSHCANNSLVAACCSYRRLIYHKSTPSPNLLFNRPQPDNTSPPSSRLASNAKVSRASLPRQIDGKIHFEFLLLPAKERFTI